MAYISKRQCNPAYVPPNIHDIRVEMGQEQAQLYGYYADTGNVRRADGTRYRDMRVATSVQISRLRAICADPLDFDWNREPAPVVRSNFNPKLIAVLERVRNFMCNNEQVVIINSRKALNDELEHRLLAAGCKVSRIDSTISNKAEQAAQFKRRSTHVMLMGLACAAGYSFDQCKNCIIGSIDYTAGNFKQAIGRVDRIASTGADIHCVLIANSIESLMFDIVAVKDDSATICVTGNRGPRDFRPVDMGEVLASAITSWKQTDGTTRAESECEQQWPALRDSIARAVGRFSLGVAA